MIKNKKLPLFLSKITSNNADSSWAWPAPYCQQPRTLSFRTGDNKDSDDNNNNNIINNNNMFKTLNSVYNSDGTPPNSDSESSPPPGGEKSVESVISELRSVDNRLFFKPCGTSSNILEEANHNNRKGAKSSSGEISYNNAAKMLKEGVVMVSMDSQDPYLDFKKSMEEMVEAQGLKDWASLEDLLCCYLKVNGKNNHGYIIGAFVDLLVNLAFNSSSSSAIITSSSSSSSSSSYSPSSPLSFYTSSNFSDDSSSTPCISSSLLEEEADDDDDDDDDEEVENEIKEIN